MCKKILFINSGPYSGYATTIRSLEFAKYLKTKGYEIFFLMAYNKNDFLEFGYNKSGINFIYSKDKPFILEKYNLFSFIKSLFNLILTLLIRTYKIHKIKPDIVYCIKPDIRNIVPFIFNKRKYIKSILDIDDLEYEMILYNYPNLNFIYKKLILFFENKSYKYFDKISVASRFLYDYYKKLGCENIFYIKNGFNKIKFENKKIIEDVNDFFIRNNFIDKKVIVYMGNLYKCFNIEKVIYIFKKVYYQNKNIRLLIIGDGPDKKRLENLCDKLNMSDKVVFTGQLEKNKVPYYLNKTDLFLFPQKNSFMNVGRRPLKLCEFIAMNKPVVTPDLGESSIELKNTGWLVPANATINDYVNKVFELLNKTEKSGISEIEKLEWKNICKKLDFISEFNIENHVKFDYKSILTNIILIFKILGLLFLNKKKKYIDSNIKYLFVEPGDQVIRNIIYYFKTNNIKYTDDKGYKNNIKNIKNSKIVFLSYSRKIYFSELLRFYIYFLYAKKYNKKTIIFFGNDYFDICESGFSKKIFYKINKYLFDKSDYIAILNSRKYLKTRYNISNNKIIYDENFVEKFWVNSEKKYNFVKLKNKIIFVYHGSILWWHGFHKFIPVFRYIKKYYKNSEFKIIGHKNILSFPKTFIKEKQFNEIFTELKHEPGLKFYGMLKRDKVIEHLVNSHLHISQLDNQSLMADTELRTCLIEAMSLGLPCLHCKSSAINSNMFKNGYNYIEINTESIEQSAEIIINYYENSEKLKNISENAVKTVDQHFIIDNWMKNFLREIKDNEL